jgi:carboxylate-amine ligase
MGVLKFVSNDYPTLGIELELQLIDVRTLELTNAIDQVLDRIPESLREQVKPELMQCYLEINTGICRTVAEAGNDLREKLEVLERVLQPLDLRLLWAATHPFSSWRDQKITVSQRYYRLVELMQDVARRLVTFGMHVHVGVESGDKAIMIVDRMLRHLPLLLALSCNSPFWEGRCTGLCSNRANVMEGLPTAGLPYGMRNWSEYVWLVNHLIATGFINSIREIWWDIRPHHNFGTVEIRVCDMPPNLEQVLALAALIQSLVTAISQDIDQGTFLPDYHPMMVQQNKWRAMRFGANAQLVDSQTCKQRSVQEWVDDFVERLRPTAESLGCSAELQQARKLPESTGAGRQIAIFQQGGSREDVVRQLLAEQPGAPWKSG